MIWKILSRNEYMFVIVTSNKNVYIIYITLALGLINYVIELTIYDLGIVSKDRLGELNILRVDRLLYATKINWNK